MADKISFTLVSPENLVLQEQVDMAVLPGENGDFGVLPHHAALIATLRPGLVAIHNDGTVIQRLFVSGGFAHVNADGCTVTTEECLPLKDLENQDLESQIKDIQIDLELARTADDQKDLQHTLTLTRAKLELIKKLSHSR